MILSAVFKHVETNVITKRSILTVAAKVYDPLGLISPVTLRLKSFVTIQVKSIGANDDFCEEWNMSIRRCCCPESYGSEVRSTKLHSFGDAPETSYGACVYLRCEHSEGIHCDLIASKTRVAPMSKQTTPRLEFLSSLRASRLTQSVKKALNEVKTIVAVTYWSDSTVVLNWIRYSNKGYKQFVENR